MTVSIRPPVFSSIREYGDRLGDVDYWAPYVRTVLDREGLDGRDLAAGFVGTYPTFVVGNKVVKLFGCFPSWRENHETELAMQLLLRNHPDIPAPVLITQGRLFDGPAPWPYLVLSRLAGRAWRDSTFRNRHVAFQLGKVIRRLHDLPLPNAPALSGDWVEEHRSGCVERHRAWASLPARLIGQIEDFLADPSPPCLIHADLTEDHLYVDETGLVGVIDWGDAIVTDPHYELVALHLGAFRGDKALLGSFLDGYGWSVDSAFPRRAMSLALLHQFDVFADIRSVLGGEHPLDEIATLEELAVLLWDVGCGSRCA